MVDRTDGDHSDENNGAPAILTSYPLAIGTFWTVALPLVRSLARLHASGAIHRAIMPANIVRDAHVGEFTFSGAPEPAAQSLSYMSPEQTGRTGRAVDQRSDLYSLGATFYEMLTGRPPFVADDQIELLHAQLALQCKAPHEIAPGIPPSLSQIVLKLLEKEPDQRYATAEGLLADLLTAQQQWHGNGDPAAFPLAQQDARRKLRIPQQLYGRDEETAILSAALDRVRTSQRELILISGPAGRGKSALAYQLEARLADQDGYFIAGKFDQLQRSMPYEGLVQAFRMLVRQLLTEPEAMLAAWRETIQAAIAPNAQIMVDVIPEIAHILGPQAAVARLEPVESRNRFTQVFTSFLNVFARPGRPFVLFLDDLQWVDVASLQLLERWMADHSAGYLLVIGAYRAEEVGLAHPLTLAVSELRKTRVRITELHLAALGGDAVAMLLADTLHQPVERCRALTELIVKKTDGNPFFIKRLLHALHERGMIRFDAGARGWVWDMAQIEQTSVTDNVLDLMVQAIARLPAPAQHLLQTGACIGYRFDLDLLAAITDNSPAAAMDVLKPALDDGLLLVAPRREDDPLVLAFVHDRVQQAAYMLLPEARRSALHLDIGRHLSRGVPAERLDAILFDVVHHLNLGAPLMREAADTIRLAELNLAAGRKAKSAAAFQAGMNYLQAGKGLLPADAPDQLPELSFAIDRELAECAYLSGQHATAERILDGALARAPTRIARADLYSLRVLAATVAGDWASALRWGREGLSVFGQEWPLDGLSEVNETESLAVMEQVRTRQIHTLADQPEVRDDEVRACMRLLSLLGPPAYFSGSEVLTFLVARGANLSLLHGTSEYSAFAYVFYGALHNARTGQYDVGYAWGQAALALARRFDNRAEESRTLEVFGLVVHVWKAPLRDSLPLMKQGYRAGTESGELAYAAFNLCGLLINGVPAGLPLEEVLRDTAVALEFARKHQNRTAIEITLPFGQFAKVMRDEMPARGSFDDGQFSEASYLAEAQGNLTALGHYWVLRLQAAYLLGDYTSARRIAREGGQGTAAGILGMVTSAEHAFYDALTLAASYADAAEPSRPGMLDEIKALHARFVVWAGYSPENYGHKAKVIAAELERIQGSPWKAMELFGEAVEDAGKRHLAQDVALANELAARLFRAHGQSRLADVYHRAALDGYRRWGAVAKVRLLEAEHGAGAGRPAMRETDGLALDALGLIRASQAISAETVPERLFERILTIAVEVAGAQSGALLLGDATALNVRGLITADDGARVTLQDTRLDDCPDVPHSIVRYVARTRTPLVLEDASHEGAFAADPQVRGPALRSVLCVPLQKLEKIVGILYLQNSAFSGAFAEARVEVVRVLASQAAVSLQNSTLLLEREHAERELRVLADNLFNENRRKTEFLATLAHELRNPLAPIRTGLELMRAAGSSPAALAEVGDMMGRQVNHMVHLIDDLMDIARINSGKVELKRQRIDLRDAVLSATEAVLPTLQKAQHQLELSLPEDALWLDADPTRLAQILGNLLTNATKYTLQGGRIRVALSEQGSIARIEVTDTGVGIPTGALSEVFNMFSQVSKSMGRSQGGLGIGLSLVRSLVQMHGGSVRADSAGEGLGSTFTVELPLSPSKRPERRSGPRPAADGAAGPRLRILIADDNVDAGMMLAALLRVADHEVSLAHDGLQALALAQGGSYDLAILDIGMPGLNGYQLAEAMRALPQHAETFLAALTGWGAEEDRRHSKRAGFDVHLTKPVGSDQIQQLVAAATARRSGEAVES